MKPASRPGPFAAVFNAIRTSGFTLLEMLVVLVVGRARVSGLPRLPGPGRGLQIHCLNNLKQVEPSRILYASDSSDQLVSKPPYTIFNASPDQQLGGG